MLIYKEGKIKMGKIKVFKIINILLMFVINKKYSIQIHIIIFKIYNN